MSTGTTRDVILDAAARLMTERGASVRLEDIAEAAEVSRQTVYLHFGSRTGLLIAMAEHIDEGGALPGLLQQVFVAPTALDALDAIVELHAEYYPVIYPIAKIFMAGRHEDEALRAAWNDRMVSRWNLYHTVVERLQGDGLLSSTWDLKVATDLLWTLTSWEVWEQLVVDRGWAKDDYLTRFRALLHQLLVAERSV